MAVICKMLVYTNDENFAGKLKKIFDDGEHAFKVEKLFIDVVNVLQRELFDVLIIDLESKGGIEGLLKIVDNVLLGIPVIVVSNEVNFEVRDGVNSKFYFLNKFAGEDEWKGVLQRVISENYVITGKGS